MFTRICACLLLSVSASAEINQWSSIHPDGPDNALGGEVSKVYFDANERAFLRTNRGNIYSRANATDAWEQHIFETDDMAFDPKELNFDPIDPLLITAIDESGQIVRTLDGGQTWSVISAFSGSVLLIVHPLDSNVIYVSTTTGELLKTIDGGDNWQSIPTVEPLFFWRLKADPSDTSILFGIFNTSEVQRSTDSGLTWTDVENGGLENLGIVYDVALVPGNSSTVYAAGGTFGDIFVSYDNGDNWIRSAGPLSSRIARVRTLAAAPQGGLLAYAGDTNGGAFRTTNGGLSWQRISNTTYAQWNNIAVSNNNQVMIGGNTGIGIPGDSGILELANDGFSDFYMQTITFAPNDHGILVASNYHGGVAGLLSGQQNWSLLNGDFGRMAVRDVAVDPQDPDKIMIATYEGMFRSFDSGVTWQPMEVPVSGLKQSVHIAPNNSQVIYIRTSSAFYKSNDDGQSWSYAGLSGSLFSTFPAAPIEISPVDSSIVNIGTQEQGLRTTFDGGETWKTTFDIFQDGAVSAIATDPLAPEVLYLTLKEGYVWRSTDFGDTWTDVTNGLDTDQTINALGVDPFIRGRLFVALSDSTIQVFEPELNQWRSLGAASLAGNCENSCKLLLDNQRQGRVILLSNGRLYEYLLDSDNDGIADELDNCTRISNSDQIDTNNDGYGNRCDPDLDNNGIVNFLDVSLLTDSFLGNNPDADFDQNGTVNFIDIQVLVDFIFQSPGPNFSGP